MSNFISIPVTASDNYIVNSNKIITCIRTSSTTTVLVVAGGASSSSSTDQIILTHAADTVADSVYASIMNAIVGSFSNGPGYVKVVVPAQAISSVAFSGGGGGGFVTSVTASLPLSSSGGTTPNIAITQSDASTDGYLSSTDWNTFNNKGNGDMLASTYDSTGQANDVYDYANALGVTQITGTIITPSTLTATADNYQPFGFSTTNMIRQDIDANRRQISGFAAPSVGVNRVIRINNINTSGYDIQFLHNNSGSIAANRLLLRDDADKNLKPNETAAFWYDHTSIRYRAFNRIG